jgi:hypothetical protein
MVLLYGTETFLFYLSGRFFLQIESDRTHVSPLSAIANSGCISRKPKTNILSFIIQLFAQKRKTSAANYLL